MHDSQFPQALQAVATVETWSHALVAPKRKDSSSISLQIIQIIDKCSDLLPSHWLCQYLLRPAL